jgi:hypothetical protein
MFKDTLYAYNVKYDGQTTLAFGAFRGNEAVLERTLGQVSLETRRKTTARG